jgi:hypothetical protein
MRGGSNHSQRIADRRAAVEIAAAPSAIPADRLACRRLQASSSATPTNLSLRNVERQKGRARTDLCSGWRSHFGWSERRH